VAVDVALQRPAYQSSTWQGWLASQANDHDLATASCTYSTMTTTPWWAVDLGAPMDVGRVCIYNQNNPGYG